MNHKKQTQGFSLVELIVVTALLAGISLTIAGILAQGTRAARSESDEILLQTSVQIAMAQLREYTIDCTALTQDDRTLTADKNGTSVTFARSANNVLTLNGEPLCKGVTQFEPLYFRDEYLLRVDWTFTQRSTAPYHTTQYVALRNRL